MIPKDPCPANYILEQIIKLEDLTRITQKPQLFFESTGTKLGDNEDVPANSRLEYNVIMPATTLPQGNSHGGFNRNEMQGDRMGGHDR